MKKEIRFRRMKIGEQDFVRRGKSCDDKAAVKEARDFGSSDAVRLLG